MWDKFLDWRQRKKESPWSFEHSIMPEFIRRVIKPTVGSGIAQLPLGKDPETRFDVWKTPEGDISPKLALRSVLDTPRRMAGGLLSVNVDAFKDFTPSQGRGTLKSEKLEAERRQREASLGRDMTPSERLQMEEELYPLPKHVRGALELAPELLLPPAAKAQKALALTRSALGRTGARTFAVSPEGAATVQRAGKYGKLTPAVQTALRTGEELLQPVAAAEEIAAKAITAPAKLAGKGVTRGVKKAAEKAEEVGLSPALRALRTGAQRGLLRGATGADVPRTRIDIDPESKGWIRVEDMPPSFREEYRDYGFDPDYPAQGNEPFDFDPKISRRKIRDEAKDMHEKTSHYLDPVEALDETLFTKNYGPEARKLFIEEWEVLDNPKLFEMGYKTLRKLREGYGKVAETPFDTNIAALEKAIKSGAVRAKANAKLAGKKVGVTDEAVKAARAGAARAVEQARVVPAAKFAGEQIVAGAKGAGRQAKKAGPPVRAGMVKVVGEKRTKAFEEAIDEMLPNSPIYSPQGFVDFMNKWWDGTFGLRVFEDAADGNWLAKQYVAKEGISPDDVGYVKAIKKAKAKVEKTYVALADKISRATGAGIGEGGTLFHNFHVDDLQPILSKFRTEQFNAIDDIEKYVQGLNWTKNLEANPNWQPPGRYNTRVATKIGYKAEIGERPPSGEFGVDHPYEPVTKADIPSWTDDAALKAKGYNEAEIDAIKEGAEAIANFYRGLRRDLWREGIIDERTYKLLSKEYKYYNPIEYVEFREAGKLHAGRAKKGGAIGVTDDGIREIMDMPNTYSALPPTGEAMAHSAITNRLKINRNSMTRNFVQMLKGSNINLEDVTDDFIRYKVRLKNGKTYNISPEEIRKYYEPEGAFTARTGSREMLELVNRMVRVPGLGKAVAKEIDTSTIDGVRTYKPKPIEKTPPYNDKTKTGYLSFYEDGRRIVYGSTGGGEVDRVYWEMLNGRGGLALRNRKEQDSIIKAANGFYRGVFVTYSPIFAIKNGIIDSLTAQIKAGVGIHKSAARIIKSIETQARGGLLKDVAAKAGVDITPDDRVRDMITASGGWNNRFYNQNEIVAQMEKEIAKAGHDGVIAANKFDLRNRLAQSVPQRLKRVVPSFGSAIEEAPRLAVAERSLKKLIGEAEFKRLMTIPREQFEKEMRDQYMPRYYVNGTRIKDIDLKARESGFAHEAEFQRAAQNGIEATLDFARGGEQIRKWNDYVLFLNATMEGLKLPFRALGINLSPVIKPARQTFLVNNKEMSEKAFIERVSGIKEEYASPIKKPDGNMESRLEWAKRISDETGDEIELPRTDFSQYEWGTPTEQWQRFSKAGIGDTKGITLTGLEQTSGGAKSVAFRLGAAVTTYWAIQNGWNKQFEYEGTPLYYDIPSYIRYNSLVFMLPPDKDENGEVLIDPRTGRPKPKYIVMPHKLREWNLFFQTATALDEGTDKDVPFDKKKWFSEVYKSTSPLTGGSLMPQLLNVAGEELSGKDFYRNNDIVDPEYQTLPLDEQYNKYTSKTARAAAGLLENLPAPEPIEEVLGSPQRLEHLIENVSGQIGEETLNLADAVIEILEDLRGVQDRPMEEKVKEYREDMTPTQRKEFLVTLDREETAEFEKELKEADAGTPFVSAIKRSYFPERGGGLRELGQTEADRRFEDKIDKQQQRQASIQVGKIRQQLRFRQQDDDKALANWTRKTAGPKLSPMDWIESHSKKTDLYKHDLESLGRRFPQSVYALPKEERDEYYNAVYTAGGKMKDIRDSADLLINAYYAITPATDDPSSMDWNNYFRARDEYIANIKATSESAGDGLYSEFVRRLEANQTDTEKAYNKAIRVISPYWNAGRDVTELFPPNVTANKPGLQETWDQYLNADTVRKQEMRNTNPVVKELVKRRTALRKQIILEDAQRNGGMPVLEAALIYWYGGNYYRSPITNAGKQYHNKLYLQ